jgi:hypothetical protein
MDEFAMTVGSVVAPLAFVASSVRPHLDAVAIPEAPDPLSLISCSCFERIQRPFLPLCFWIILLLRHRLPRFFNCEVFAVSLI